MKIPTKTDQCKFIPFQVLSLSSTFFSAVATIQKYFQEEFQAVLPQLYLYHRAFAGIYSADQHFYKFSAPDWRGDSLFIDSKILRLQHLHDFVETEIQDVTAEMDRLLFYRFRLDEDCVIHDDPSQRMGSYGFVDDPNNAWASEPGVLQHILETPDLFDRFAYRNEQLQVVWKPSPCLSYSKQIFDLMMRIFILILITFGCPGRGTELLSMLLRNVSAGSIRNIFVMFGCIFLRGSYNKTSSFTNADKPIVRIPLPEVGLLLVRMLVYLRPVFCDFQRVFHPDLYHDAMHLLLPGFDRPLETRDISSALSSLFGDQWGIHMNLARFRQMTSFIFECNSELFHIESTASSAAKQLGHGDEVHHANYSGDERFPSGLNDTLFRDNAITSAKYHRLIGFELRLLELIQQGRCRQRQILSEVESVMRGHAIGAPGPAPSAAPPTFTAADVAAELHHLLLPSIHQDVAQGVASLAYHTNPTQRPNEVIIRSAAPLHISLVASFRMFLQLSGVADPLSTFSGEVQRDALVVMARKQRHLVYVGPTCAYVCRYLVESYSLYSQAVENRHPACFFPGRRTPSWSPYGSSPSAR